MIDLAKVSRAFDRGAQSYDRLAEIQRSVADDLFSGVESEVKGADKIVDLGCGTGRLLRRCQVVNPRAHLTGVDCSAAMLTLSRAAVAGATWIESSLDDVPLDTGSQSMVISTSAIQWVPVGDALLEASRLVSPGGMVAISSYLSETLSEWREIWGATELVMPTERQFRTAVSRAGLSVLSLNTEWRTQYCRDFDAAVASVRDLGAGANRRPSAGLLGRQRYAQIKARVDCVATELGGFPMRYQVVNLVAVKR